MTPASLLMLSSSVLVAALGLIHLIYTLFTNNLSPEIVNIKTMMQTNRLVITKQTTLWRAWIGFNISHSLGAILFGLTYGYIAIIEPQLFFSSFYLLTLGFLFLLGMVILSKFCWFNIPLIGTSIALICYLVALLFTCW